jgi:hypothetical protein
MKGLSSALLKQAFRHYFTQAYPDGDHTIPPSKAHCLALHESIDLETLFASPLCQTISDCKGVFRGFSFRLGSAVFPHLKLQVTECGRDGALVFAVDTHDAITLEAGHPEAKKLARLQAANRRLKERIERAWEAAGLLTFNGLLRQELSQQ